MSLIKFTLRPEYENLTGGTVVVGDGGMIDVGAELQRGDGAIITGDPMQIEALKQYQGADGPVLVMEYADEDQEATLAEREVLGRTGSQPATFDPGVHAQTVPTSEGESVAGATTTNAERLQAAQSAEAEAQHGDEGESGYGGMKVDELRGELETRGLPTNGNKADLIAALELDDQNRENAS